MKIVYEKLSSSEDIYISESNQNQRLLVWFEDDFDWFVYYCDDLTSQVFINKIIDKGIKGGASALFSLSNFEVIKDTEQFDKYSEWITRNYNYSGIHKGNDLDV